MTNFRKYKAYVDGGCPGNGAAAHYMFGSYIIYNDKDEEVFKDLNFTIHEKNRITNNVAEWKSLLQLLMVIKRHNYKPCTIYMDSKLVVNQYKGIYRIKNNYLKSVANQAKNFVSPEISIHWISGKEMKEVLGH